MAVVTAHPSADDAVRALRGRVDEIFEKPVRPDEIIAAAPALVARGRAVRSARKGPGSVLGPGP